MNVTSEVETLTFRRGKTYRSDLIL